MSTARMNGMTYSATNIVATPYKAVARSSWIERRTAVGLNASLGRRSAAPVVAVAIYPKMEPKQWNIGGGQQTTSVGVKPIRVAMKKPLLRIPV